MHTICADLGSTITKIIEVDENNKIINKNIYQKEEPKKLLKNFIESNKGLFLKNQSFVNR